MSDTYYPPGDGDYTLIQMHDMQRQYLARGGWAIPAVAKLPTYVYQEYPKYVVVDGVEVGIATDAGHEARLLEAHAAKLTSQVAATKEQMAPLLPAKKL
jgi:hypothetical protein